MSSHPNIAQPADTTAEIGFGATALEWINASLDPNKAYWRLVLEEGAEALAPNLQTRAGVVRYKGRIWPITVNDGGQNNSYPCSLYTQYVRYALAELSLVPSRWQRCGAWLALNALGLALRGAQIDRTVQWSSWLLSTNLHDKALADAAVAVREALCSQFPDHAILIRNIHGFEDPLLPQKLEDAGYDLITSRQIYFFDGKPADYQARSDVRRDSKALKALSEYSVMEHGDFATTDAPRVAELYRMLYIEKHSALNPQYTPRFVERAINERLLEFRGLRHHSGRIDGVFACFSREDVTSTPFIGYDTQLPAELGLYRCLVSMLLKRVAETKALLNYSSGAGAFKRRRGAIPAIEFNALYIRHLPTYRRKIFEALRDTVNRFGREFLEQNEI